MHVLSNGLMRVREEILALREAREGFLSHLDQETRDRRAAVSQMLTDFSKTFSEAARTTKADRRAFVSGLKRAVAGLQKGVRTDIGGVQQAFMDLRTKASGSPGRARKRAEQKAEARSQEDQPKPESGPAEGQLDKPEGKKRERQPEKRQAAPRRHRRR